MLLGSLLRDGAVYGVARLVAGLVGFLILPVYTRSLSAPEYGELEYLLALSALIAPIFTLEVSQGLSRVQGDARSLDEKASYLSSAVVFVVANASVLSLATVAFDLLKEVPVLGEAGAGTKALLLLMALVQSIATILVNFLRYELRGSAYAWSSLLQAMLLLGGAYIAVVHMKAGMKGALAAQVASSVAVVVFILLTQKLHIRPVVDRAALWKMLAFSAPLSVNCILSFFASYFDRLAITNLLGSEAMGIYAVAARLGGIVGMAATVFHLALLPLVYKNHGEKTTPVELDVAFRIFLWLMLSMCAALSYFSETLVFLFAPGKEYGDASRLVPILSITFLLTSAPLFSPGLWLARDTRRIMGVTFLSAATAVVLNFALIPLYGLVGAAIAAFGAAALNAAILFGLGQKSYRVPFAWRRVAGGVAATMLIIGVASHWHDPLRHLEALFLVIGTIVIAGFMLMRPSELRRVSFLLVAGVGGGKAA